MGTVWRCERCAFGHEPLADRIHVSYKLGQAGKLLLALPARRHKVHGPMRCILRACRHFEDLDNGTEWQSAPRVCFEKAMAIHLTQLQEGCYPPEHSSDVDLPWSVQSIPGRCGGQAQRPESLVVGDCLGNCRSTCFKQVFFFRTCFKDRFRHLPSGRDKKL